MSRGSSSTRIRKAPAIALALEAKRKADNAWCECEVSIDGSNGSLCVLKVLFEDPEHTVDSISTLSEATRRLRTRSKALAKGQCVQLQEGDLVLASRNHNAVNFYDACITKIQRFQHSARAKCKCIIELAWLESSEKEVISSVPVSQMRQIIHGEILKHPVISEWMNSVKLEISQSFEDSSDIGSDVQAQLEKEIDRLTVIAESLPAAETAGAPGRGRSGRALARSKKSSSVCKGTKPAEAAVEEKPNPEFQVPVIPRAHLSPLAARAALAATVKDLPAGSPLSAKLLPTDLLGDQISKEVRLLEDTVPVANSYQRKSKTSAVKKRGKGATRQGPPAKAVLTHLSPSISCAKPKLLSPIQECLNMKESSETASKAPKSFLSRQSRSTKQKNFPGKENASPIAQACKKVETSAVRLSTRLRKEITNSVLSQPESSEDSHMEIDATDRGKTITVAIRATKRGRVAQSHLVAIKSDSKASTGSKPSDDETQSKTVAIREEVVMEYEALTAVQANQKVSKAKRNGYGPVKSEMKFFTKGALTPETVIEGSQRTKRRNDSWIEERQPVTTNSCMDSSMETVPITAKRIKTEQNQASGIENFFKEVRSEKGARATSKGASSYVQTFRGPKEGTTCECDDVPLPSADEIRAKRVLSDRTLKTEQVTKDEVLQSTAAKTAEEPQAVAKRGRPRKKTVLGSAHEGEETVKMDGSSLYWKVEQDESGNEGSKQIQKKEPVGRKRQQQQATGTRQANAVMTVKGANELASLGSAQEGEPEDEVVKVNGSSFCEGEQNGGGNEKQILVKEPVGRKRQQQQSTRTRRAKKLKNVENVKEPASLKKELAEEVNSSAMQVCVKDEIALEYNNDDDANAKAGGGLLSLINTSARKKGKEEGTQDVSVEMVKLRFRRVSFDALPVRFGLGITGWLPPTPPPPPAPTPQQQTSPANSEKHMLPPLGIGDTSNRLQSAQLPPPPCPRGTEKPSTEVSVLCEQKNLLIDVSAKPRSRRQLSKASRNKSLVQEESFLSVADAEQEKSSTSLPNATANSKQRCRQVSTRSRKVS